MYQGVLPGEVSARSVGAQNSAYTGCVFPPRKVYYGQCAVKQRVELLRKRFAKRQELLCQIWRFCYVLELGNHHRPRRSHWLDFTVCDAIHRAGEPQTVVSYCLAVADLSPALSRAGHLPAAG